MNNNRLTPRCCLHAGNGIPSILILLLAGLACVAGLLSAWQVQAADVSPVGTGRRSSREADLFAGLDLPPKELGGVRLCGSGAGWHFDHRKAQ